ncbi:SRPBCC family protein [Bacillus solimangrovi]|uniref:ATPase n=1 Tax=Bacillus solimangrovi TaxID=1305675 RepID=A0A1E5LI85_9BACI|nr:SRPBCC domain-containing protein [Bacillus solimangrovi]OEH93790.1 ATPase [Bacillus solimangrovi]
MKTSSINPSLHKDILIHAPIDVVWGAWMTSQNVAGWFAPEAVVEAREGGEFELYFVPGNKEGMNTKGCTIQKIVPNKKLEFNWKGPDQFETIMNNENELTTVNVTFIGDDERTKVSITHLNWGEGDLWKEAYNWHEMAWEGVLKSLKSFVESEKGDICCQSE